MPDRDDIDDTPAPDRLADRLRAADVADLEGRYDLATAILEDVVAAAGPAALSDATAPPVHADILVRALTRLAALRGYTGDLDGASTAIDRAAAVADAVDLPPVTRIDLALETARLDMERASPERAEARAVDACEAARTLPVGRERDLALARSLRTAGSVARVRGEHDVARERLGAAIRRASSVAEADPEDRHARMELAHAYVELGVCEKFAGRYADSGAAYDRARAIVVEVGGPDHPDLASIHHNLGGLAHARGDADAGLADARLAVDLRERALGPDHLATVLDRAALAAILDRVGRSAEAEAMLQDCAERMERTIGPDHRELAVVLNNLAAIAQRAGRYADAAALYERALVIKERATGPQSPSLAITLNNLGTALRHLGRTGEAAAHYRRAIDILARDGGADHPDLAVVRRNLDRLPHADRGDVSAG